VTHKSDYADYNEESSDGDACVHHHAVVGHCRRLGIIISDLKFNVIFFLKLERYFEAVNFQIDVKISILRKMDA